MCITRPVPSHVNTVIQGDSLKMAKKYTLNDLGKMLEKLHEDSSETKKEVENINKKLDKIMSNSAVHQEKIVELCAAAQKQAVKINQMEQHNRNECLKITGLVLKENEKRSNHTVKASAYENVLRPLLELAAEDTEDDLSKVPDLHSLVKNAHILPKPKSAPVDSPNPVILRLNAVDLRGKLFKYKKRFTASHPTINFYEDLTRVNSLALLRTREREDVDKAWTRNGLILFTKCDDNRTTKKIHRLQDPFAVLSKDDISKLNIPYPTDLHLEAVNKDVSEDESGDEGVTNST